MNIEKIEKYLDKKTDESEETVTQSMQHPHGGRGRQGHNKGITCPHCGKTIDLER